MSRVLVDTNVVISWLIARDNEQQARAEILFTEVANGSVDLLVHQQVLTEIAYVLKRFYRVAPEKIAMSLQSLVDLVGVQIVDDVPWLDFFELWPATFPDFADATLAAVASAKKARVATFDEAFRKLLGPRAYPMAR